MTFIRKVPPPFLAANYAFGADPPPKHDNVISGWSQNNPQPQVFGILVQQKSNRGIGGILPTLWLSEIEQTTKKIKH
jgi:hypothetical protein